MASDGIEPASLSETVHYLFIPSDASQPIREVDLILGSTQESEDHYKEECHRLLGGPMEKVHFVYSEDLMCKLLGTNPQMGRDLLAYEAYITCSGNTSGASDSQSQQQPQAINIRASNLLLARHYPVRGNTLVKMPIYRRTVHGDQIIEHGRLTEQHLRSEEFRKRVALFNGMMDAARVRFPPATYIEECAFA